jgi:hypothetical protein
MPPRFWGMLSRLPGHRRRPQRHQQDARLGLAIASNADGDLREHADVIEITDVLDLSRWTKHCPGMRVVVRRELPHPGATLDAFEIRDGYRYQVFTTNTRRGQLAFLEARHRAHARVENRIRTGKDTGLGHLPSRHQNINEVWVTKTSTKSGSSSR